jgi:preprotein translocase subunit SecA
MLRGLISKFIGTASTREIARLQSYVEEINGLEPEFEALSDAQLRAISEQFRQRLQDGETLDDLMVEAFAAVREAAKRTIGLRHYDVQLIGGMILHQSAIAEMKTGEGKTLSATLPLYLNALTGKGAHLVTPNDYLSKVGVQWMGPIYHALGLSVGVIQSAAANDNMGSFVFDAGYPSADDRFMNLRPVSRREAYQADVTYGTNNEFGFDYLRDNMVRDLSECVQRDLHYAIIDEVDNILIDEARTPLIISGPAEESSDLYKRFARIVPRLHLSSPESVEAEAPDGDYVLDLRTQVVTLTDQGVERVEQMVPEVGADDGLYDPEHAHMLPYLDNALRAYVTYHRDRDYIVDQNGEVIIVDEFTGRLMHGRRFSEGLHQAIEAKERVEVQRESLTYATITFQNYFRMYEKLAGMTGTAKTEEEEFQSIYDLDVIVLPTNVEYRATYGNMESHERDLEEIQEVQFAGVLNGHVDDLANFGLQHLTVTTYELSDGNGRRYFKRLDLPDVIYGDEKAKFHAVVDEIEALHEARRPVLVGTVAIETSERLSRMLKRRGVRHEVLNAKYHEKEAVIIAQAGQPGAVTIATNMAGRGVDIKLGGDPEGVARERLRRQGIDLTEIPQTDWNHALDMLRRGEDVTTTYTEPWAHILKDAAADCATDQAQVLASGGLHILGTERHEARRIDNQLRGRAGRQGDPGSSRFYISLEDELMRRFGGERVQSLMGRVGMGMGQDVPLQHSWLDKTIESAQKRVEGYNFDIRKHVLEYDNVVNQQREVIYAQRRKVLSASDLREQILRMVEDEIDRVVANHTASPYPDEWDVRGLHGELRNFLPLPSDFNYHRWADLESAEAIADQLCEVAEKFYDEEYQSVGHQIFRQMAREDVTLQVLADSSDPSQRLMHQRAMERLEEQLDKDQLKKPIRQLPDGMKEQIEAAITDAYRIFRDRQLMLQAVDRLWVRHLTDLSALREGIGLRAFGQQNPLVAYRKEAHEMYESLMIRIQQSVARSVYWMPVKATPARSQQRPQSPRKLRASRPSLAHQTSTRQPSTPAPRVVDETPGRNDPCWCGSGKKYKHCHLRSDRKSGRA